MIRKIFFSLLIISFSMNSHSQTVSIKEHYGFIADVGNNNHLLIKRHILPFEISVSHSIKEKYSWQRLIKFSCKGISLKTTNLHNPEYLGYLVSLTPYINIGIVNRSFYNLNIKGAMGLVYSSKIYHPVENFRNTYFSSHINAAFGFGLENSLKISGPVYFLAGFDFIHHSNGETNQPNDGMNTASVYAGLSYNFQNKKYEVHSELPEFTRKGNFQLTTTAGWKVVDYRTEKKYSAASLSCDYIFNITPIQNIGIGISTYYDKSVISYEPQGQIPVSYKKITLGAHLIHEFNFYPLMILFQAGYYIIGDDVPFHSDYYNRLGIKYFINNDFFINLTHKSHFFFKGDNIEWGIGYKI